MVHHTVEKVEGDDPCEEKDATSDEDDSNQEGILSSLPLFFEGTESNHAIDCPKRKR